MTKHWRDLEIIVEYKKYDVLISKLQDFYNYHEIDTLVEMLNSLAARGFIIFLTIKDAKW